MSRVGIDLSATRCHLIEVRSAGRLPRWSGVTRANETRVVSFETIPYGWSDPGPVSAALRRWLGDRKRGRYTGFPRRLWRPSAGTVLGTSPPRRGSRAAVTVWGLSSAHRLMVLPAAAPSELAGLAQREAAGDVPLLQQTEVISGIHVGASRGFSTTAARCEVSFAAASAPEIRARIQPLIDAGFVIETVTTPPLALSSIARLRRGTVPGAAVALLALGSTVSALAIVRDGLLLLAREMPWGYEAFGGPFAEREQLVAKLAAELRRSFLFFKQSNRTEIGQVMLCGDAPELRAFTAPLIMALDLEVETLDSLEGIDAAALPEPAEVFRERVANFRLAWAVVADTQPPINLIPAEIAARQKSTRPKIQLIGAAAAAAVIFGLIGFAYFNRMARPTGHPSAGAALAAPARRPPELSIPAPKPRSAESNSASVQPFEPGERVLPPTIDESSAAVRPLRPPSSARPPGAGTASRIEKPVAPAVTDPVVRSILYSAERRVALIDNRIVGIGDQVNAGRIVEIEPGAVVIETPRGERRRFILRAVPLLGGLRQ